MPRINPRSSGLESLRKWNNYYRNNTFPMVICCVRCGKWRETSEFEEKSDVPGSWDCSMWITSDGQKGNCEMPSDVNEDNYVDEDYTPGSLVWAKMDGHPNWPAMIEDDPDEEEYCKDLKTDAKYHVVFMGDPPSRCWINVKRLVPFKMPTSNEVGCKPFKGKKLRIAVEEAERAIKMTKQNRLLTFSLAARLENNRRTESKDGSSKVKNVRKRRVLQKDTDESSQVKSVRRKRVLQKEAGESSEIKSDRRGALLQKYTRGKTTINLCVVDSESDEDDDYLGSIFGKYLEQKYPPLFLTF